MIRLTNALGAEMTLPLTMAFKRVPLEINIPSQPLLGRDGDVITGKATLRPRRFVLEGRLYNRDRERIRQDLDALLAFLMHPPIEVYRQHTHDRFLHARVIGAPQDWIDRGAELGLQIPMIAHDPYWYGQEVTANISDAQVITIDGTAPTYPIITTASSVTSLSVTNGLTGKQIIVSDTTGVIEIDNTQQTVTVDGDNRLDLINNGWLLQGFELLPGDNHITTNTTIAVTYRPRWY